jgi:GNAT superfamily N-acetyltransferase
MGQARESDAAESVEQFTSSWKLIIQDLPGPEISDDAGLSFRWADHTFPFWNAVFLSEPVEDADVLRRRLRTAAEYMRKKRESGLVWVFEEYLSKSAQRKLLEILQEERLEFALPATGMAGEIFPLQTPALPTLHIARVVNESMLRDYVQINCQAYGMPLELGHGALEPTLWIERSYSYLGYENGRAVAAASAIVNAGCLFLALVATRPEAQKRGYAEAVARFALQSAHEATGLMRTTLHATDAGRPVYKRLGYYDTTKIMAYKLSQ